MTEYKIIEYQGREHLISTMHLGPDYTVYRFHHPTPSSSTSLPPPYFTSGDFKWLENNEFRVIRPAFLLSQACYEKNGPWGESHFILDPNSSAEENGVDVDDSKYYVVEAYALRKAFQDAMIPDWHVGSGSVPLSLSSIDLLFPPDFNLRTPVQFRQEVKKLHHGFLLFAPPRSSAGYFQGMFLAAFVGSVTKAFQMLRTYIEGDAPHIVVLSGEEKKLKRRLKLLKSRTSDPNSAFLRYERTSSSSETIDRFSFSLNHLRQLEAAIGPFIKKTFPNHLFPGAEIDGGFCNFTYSRTDGTLRFRFSYKLI